VKNAGAPPTLYNHFKNYSTDAKNKCDLSFEGLLGI